MQILHHGAVNGVTGSCHQLLLNAGEDSSNQSHKTTHGHRHMGAPTSYLVDCGLFQGAETAGKSSAEQLAIDFDISTVQALIVTHCHIDHVGRIPYLLAAGFDKPIFATTATASLLPLVIEDAIKVGVTRDKKLINAYLNRLQQLLVPLVYNQWQALTVNTAVNSQSGAVLHRRVDIDKSSVETPSQVNITEARFKFKPAGHILGSAYVEIDLIGQSKTAVGYQPYKHRVVFSGDLGATYTPLLACPKAPYRADTLVIESTYGDKNHMGRKQRTQTLKRVIETAVSDNGVVLIPAFSIGRTQELLYELEQIIYQNQTDPVWESIDVIVDSPMAASFTDKYCEFVLLWDKEANTRVKQGRHPLDFSQLVTIDTHSQHLRLVNYLAHRDKPAIVIAASGMCSGGRIVNYLKALLTDSKADVLFVGYQAQGTLGRNIQQYGPKGGYVFIEEQRIDIKAGIHTISGYSAHADQTNLINFVKRMRHKPVHIRIVHGDDKAKLALADCYQQLLPECEVQIGTDQFDEKDTEKNKLILF
ncbi:MBL fold metallo-hydrolase RNA specificity domain-containing protein [Shewanella maritima]|uniref:MBL fold metallo-hydrolase RNA specificity domain-containing protein n=1 Tax=Shewanella maritima TaxID=2520507 RepID=UPI003735470B